MTWSKPFYFNKNIKILDETIQYILSITIFDELLFNAQILQLVGLNHASFSNLFMFLFMFLLINPFQANVPFLYSPKVFWRFQGV